MKSKRTRRLMLRFAPLLVLLGTAAACQSPAVSPATTFPEVRPSRSVRVPRPERRAILDGVPLLHVARDELPLVSLIVLLPYGASDDPPGKSGLAALTASMLDEGAGERDALSLADELDFLGASLSISADRESSVVALEVLRGNLEPALDIVADVLARPRFEEKEWNRVKTIWINDLAQSRENPGQVARLVGSRIFFGDEHPYGRPESGLSDDVESISLDDVRTFHSIFWRADRATVISAGAVSADDLAGLLETRLSTWKSAGKAPEIGGGVNPPARDRPRIVAVDKPGSAQTVIRIYGEGISRLSPDHAALSFANVIFGRSFTSRLNHNLRETHGYTYGAGSDFSRLRRPGVFLSASSVRANVTGESISEFIKEYRRIANGGIEKGEVEKARATLGQMFIGRLESLGATVQLFAEYVRVGLPLEEVQRSIDSLRTIDVEETEKAAKKYIRWDDATMVLVGDLGTITKAVEGLGLGKVTIVDEEGNPVTR